MERFRETLSGINDSFFDTLPDLLAAAGILLLFYIAAKFLRHSAEKFIRKFSKDPAVVRLLSTIIWFVVFGIGIVVSMSTLGLVTAVTSVLAGAGILGIALGFAFQELAANLIAGVTLILQKPLKIGSLVKVEDYFGVVQKINLRMTEIRTLDGKTVYIPNKVLIASPLSDLNALGLRRVEIEVGVSYGDDLEKVKEVTLKTLGKIPGVDKKRPVDVYFKEFSDFSVNFLAYFWIKFENEPEFLEARSQAIMNIRKAFKENGITIPFPIRTLDFGIKGGTRFDELK